jgi:hypothetical protein
VNWLPFFVAALVAFGFLRLMDRWFSRRARVLGAIGIMNAASGPEIAERCGFTQLLVNKELNEARAQGYVDRCFYYGELRWALTPAGRSFVWYDTPSWKTVH